jgi:hypothetical protein
LISASAASTPIRLPVGTTGQVLKANSATTSGLEWGTVDADIEGVTAGTGISGGGTSGTVTITNSMATAIDAKGDLVAGTGADAFARLGVGANGTVLTAASGEATGLSWATPAVSGTSWTLLNSGGTALTGAQTVTVSGISGKNKIMVVVIQASSASSDSFITIRLNTDTGSNYYWAGNITIVQGSYAAANFLGDINFPGDGIPLGRMSGAVGSEVSGTAIFDGCNTTGVKSFQLNGGGTTTGNSGSRLYNTGGYYNSASTISSVSVFSSSGNLDAGTVYVYTSAS